VSDFNVTNVLVVDDKLYSIDEHDMLGKRDKIVGDKNMKIYKKNNKQLDSIFKDLYENKEGKKQSIVKVLTKYNYTQFIEKVLDNYETLRDRFNTEL